jgi:hypothetical protein
VARMSQSPFRLGRRCGAGRRHQPHVRCRCIAMANGRCQHHGGKSTGPKTPEGMARTVAAVVSGRRAWLKRLQAQGGPMTMGRKSGAAWITDRMRERARAEASRLTGGWTPPYTAFDSGKLVMALLRSAKGSLKARERALELLRAAAAQPAEPLSRERLVAVAERRLHELHLPIR